jgi:AcrR family transcriptional regulator
VRDEQARRTRRAIVTAAHDLFLAQGYAATTIDGIAEAAHVSRRTAFNSVGGKAALLKLALDWAIVGDDEPITMADRPAIKAIQAESDPGQRKALMLWAQKVTESPPAPRHSAKFSPPEPISTRRPQSCSPRRAATE